MILQRPSVQVWFRIRLFDRNLTFSLKLKSRKKIDKKFESDYESDNDLVSTSRVLEKCQVRKYLLYLNKFKSQYLVSQFPFFFRFQFTNNPMIDIEDKLFQNIEYIKFCPSKY
jgi:hypothetical protein